MKPTLSTALILTLAVPVAAQERQKAEANWKEGKVTIDYGAPSWKTEFAEAMTKQATWRLGSNDPTRVTMTCGLKTNNGFIPAGEYGMAMEKNDQGEWDLVVYSGDGQFSKGRPAWSIKPAKAKKDADAAGKLSIDLSDDKQMAVRFGPYASVFALEPIPMHPAVEAEFARMPTKVEIMAVPIEGKVDNLGIGSASMSRNDVTMAWNLALTIDGNTATLAFDNARAGAIASEKKGIEATVKRVKGRLDTADENMKAQIEAFLAQQEKALEKLNGEAAMAERYKAKHSFTGEVGKRDAAASTLAFESKRIEGGIVLTFGAGDKTATFNVKPSEFRKPRR